MQKKSIKRITLTRLLKVFLLAVIIIFIAIALSYKSFFQFVIENKVITISEIIKAGLTSHMKADIMDKRAYFLNELTSIYDIKSIKIIRGDAVSKQFGESILFEKKLTDNLRDILDKKEVYIQWDDMNSSVEAIVPYIANSEGTLNCLECHNVKNGDVLGAVNITMDTNEYQNFAIKNAYIIAGVLLFLALMIIQNMFHVIENYISKPLSSIIYEGKLAYFSHYDIDSGKYDSKELEDVVENVNKFNHDVLEKEKELKHKNTQLQKLNESIEATLKDTMLAVGRIEEIRSGETKRHTQRVATISTMIAVAYGLSEEQINLIEFASPLHDIGKVGISDSILNKPEQLTYEEYEVMKTHTLMGYNILKHSENKILQTAASIAHEHHEKYDGSGYPQGLKGDEINIFARIVAIVDVFDALLSKRVYKDIWKTEDVVANLKKERGKHFDPVIVDIVLENIDEYIETVKSLSV